MRPKTKQAEVIIVGGGLAGLSAAVYLGRALREVLVVDNGKSMARWEPHVQNYLGFPRGVGGAELVRRAREQARLYGARIVKDEILWAKRRQELFRLRGKKGFYICRKLLLATGIFHIPPDLPGLKACLGNSMFFCKDCDGYRVQGKKVAVYGWTDEAVDYALEMLFYSPCVFVLTNRRKPRWSPASQRRLREYHIPVYHDHITDVEHADGKIRSIHLEHERALTVDALFTTRGDIYYNKLAHGLGAGVDKAGEIRIDLQHHTSVQGLYAAGCVTPANCQMIIASGEGAAAAQSINRALFQESLRNHSLRRFRSLQVRTRTVKPTIRRRNKFSGKDPTAKPFRPN